MAIKKVLALTIFLISQLLQANPVIKIGVDEFPPYFSQNSASGGILTEIISESFKIVGYSVEFVWVPWKRALVMTESGSLDGTAGWFSTTEREKVFIVSPPLIADSQSFFYLKEKKFNWIDIDSLSGLRIGATSGYDYGSAFHEAEKAGNFIVEWVSTDLQNFRKLFTGRIDVFPMNTIAGYEILKNNFSAEELSLITHHPKVLRSEPLHMLFHRSPEHQAIMNDFARGFAILKDSGRFSTYIY
ncbi:MAG: transporter substrate-binding domain-containing protein [Spirochaetales bacterium]|nr:transporter substrate-binding domain-containing protein [Spirochaetales bacterium]